MNKFEETFARRCLKPKAECDLPGRLRMKFSHYNMLPKEALPYLHYVRDVLAMLPGVNDVQVNARIGTILVLYDATITNTRRIMRWVDIVVDTGIEIANDKEWEGKDVAEIEQLVRDRLILRLPQQGGNAVKTCNAQTLESALTEEGAQTEAAPDEEAETIEAASNDDVQAEATQEQAETTEAAANDDIQVEAADKQTEAVQAEEASIEPGIARQEEG